MMTIDDMLSQVAKIKGATAPVSTSPVKPQINIPASVAESKPVEATYKPVLSLTLAKEIIYCIETGAKKLGVNAVISVVNDSGVLIALEAMDNSMMVSVKASQDKAYTAAALKMPTHVVLEKARGGDLDGLTNGNGILMLGGGYPLICNGQIYGAVGVSGGTKEEDATLARLGVQYLEERLKMIGQTKEA